MNTDPFRSGRWPVMILLVVSVGFNYIDRGSLSVAAPALSKELSLSPATLGLLLSSFFWSYAGFMVFAGWLADRFDVGLVLGIGYVVWTLATIGTGFANSLSEILILRILLGCGESVAYPTYSRFIANTFEIHQRGLPNAMIDAGAKIGPALGILLGGVLVAHYGWRSMFLVLGFVGMLWLLPWYWVAPRKTAHGRLPTGGPGLLEILTWQEAWGTFLGNFCANYAYYFLMTWLPTYLVMERRVSMEQMAVLGSLPFWGSAATSLLGGWMSDRWIGRGGDPTMVRKAFVVIGLLVSTLMLPAGLVSDLRTSMVLMIMVYLAFGFYSSNHLAITQTLAGPLAAGKWTGLQNAMANVGGVVAPFVTGVIVSETGSFFFAFLSATIIVVIGAASYLFLVRRVKPIEWRRS